MGAREEMWIIVRLRRKTHEKLRSISATWKRAYERGGNSPADPDRASLSIDAAVRELIRRLEDHKKRSKKAAAAKRARRAPQPRTVPEDDLGPYLPFDKDGVYTDNPGVTWVGKNESPDR